MCILELSLLQNGTTTKARNGRKQMKLHYLPTALSSRSCLPLSRCAVVLVLLLVTSLVWTFWAAHVLQKQQLLQSTTMSSAASETRVAVGRTKSPTDTPTIALQTLNKTPPPVHHKCTTATWIEVDNDGAGGLKSSTTEQVQQDCVGGEIDLNSPGLWYTFQGTGGHVVLVTDYMSKRLHVPLYKGSCTGVNGQGLQCVSGYYVTWVSTKVLFRTNLEETYFVVMRGSFLLSGPWRVTISRVAEPKSKICSMATPLSVDRSLSFDLSSRMQVGIRDCAGNDTTGFHDIDNRPGGLWFSLLGVGANVTVAIPRLRIPMAVYEGNTCNRAMLLQCTSVYTTVPVGGGDVRLTFMAQADTMYYVHLDTDVRINLEPYFVAKAMAVENDGCLTASSITVGSTVIVNWTFATPDADKVADDCANGRVGETTLEQDYMPYTFKDQVGVWYRIRGAGSLVVVHASAYKARISVYKGNCRTSARGPGFPFDSSLRTTDSLHCVAGIDNLRQKLFFATDIGRTYYMLMQRDKSFRTEPALMSLTGALPPTNDVCARATSIDIGSSVFGDATLASLDKGAVPGDCTKSSKAPYPGLWYTFQGTGSALTITACDKDINSDGNFVSIYAGSCHSKGTLYCVAGQDASCTVPRLVFQTAVNRTYYVLVHGPVATFSLIISHATVPINDECAGAIPLLAGRPWTNGNVTFATPDDKHGLANCGPRSHWAIPQQAGLWYRFDGTGLNMTVFKATRPEAYLSIYEGQCQSPSQTATAVSTEPQTSTLQCVSPTSFTVIRDNGQFSGTLLSTKTNVMYYVVMRVWLIAAGMSPARFASPCPTT